MYNASAQFHAASVLDSAAIRLLFDFGTTIFTNEDLTEVKLTEAICAEDELTIGLAPSASLTASIINTHRLLSGFEYGRADVSAAVTVNAVSYSPPAGANCYAIDNYGSSDQEVLTGHSTAPYLRVNGNPVQLQPGFAVHAIAIRENTIYCIGSAGQVYAYCHGGNTWGSMNSMSWNHLSDYTWGDLLLDIRYVQTDPSAFMTAKLARWAASGRGLSQQADIVYEFDSTITTWEYVPLGAFDMARPERRNEDTVTVTATDLMTAFDVEASEWWNSLSFPITLGNIASSLCASVGLALLTSSFINSAYSYPEAPVSFDGKTKREVLKWIAAAACSSARIDRTGQGVELVWFATQNIIASPVYKLTVAEYQVAKIDKLCVRGSENDIGVIIPADDPTKTNAYIILDNPFLYGATDSSIRARSTPIYDRLITFSPFRPYTAKTNCDWSIQPGDVIEIGEDICPIYSQSIIFNGAARVTYSATGAQRRPTESSVNRERFERNRAIHELVVDVNGIASRIESAEGDIAELELTAQGLTVTVGGLSAAQNASKLAFDINGLHIAGGGFDIKNNANQTVLYADTAGNLTFKGALSGATGSFSGAITAAEGTIGGFEIHPTYLYGTKIRIHSDDGLIENKSTISGVEHAIQLFEASMIFYKGGQQMTRVDTGDFGVRFTTNTGTQQNTVGDIALIPKSATVYIGNGGSASDKQNRIICDYPATASGSANVRWVQRTSDPYNGKYSLGWVGSSRRFKKNIRDIETDCCCVIDSLRPVTYEPKNNDEKGVFYGFIAEEVSVVDEMLIDTVKNDKGENVIQTVQYDRIPVLLVKDAQETHRRLADIEKALKERMC